MCARAHTKQFHNVREMFFIFFLLISASFVVILADVILCFIYSALQSKCCTWYFFFSSSISFLFKIFTLYLCIWPKSYHCLITFIQLLFWSRWKCINYTMNSLYIYCTCLYSFHSLCQLAVWRRGTELKKKKPTVLHFERREKKPSHQHLFIEQENKA